MAREFSVTLRTLRFYEDRGLIRPERRGLTRLYSEAERERVRLILLYRRIGLTLTEIKRLMDFEAIDGETPRQLESSLSIFQRQATALRAERDRIEETLGELSALIEDVQQRLSGTN